MSRGLPVSMSPLMPLWAQIMDGPPTRASSRTRSRNARPRLSSSSIHPSFHLPGMVWRHDVSNMYADGSALACPSVYTFHALGWHVSTQLSIDSSAVGTTGSTTEWLRRRVVPPRLSKSRRVAAISEL
jgi:hypothetical protein